ncbi:MAG: VOC family protein [Bacteroidales bacterium]|nr:VOC family protein [Bacteroidales bacterium]
MLQHIALTINDSEEIENFYENILLFSLKHKFSVNGEITRQIFNTGETVDVYMMGHQDTHLEIFLSPKKERKVFSHICLAYWKAEITYKKAVEFGYKALVKKNPVNDTYFIWDKSGNMFEIKEIVE